MPGVRGEVLATVGQPLQGGVDLVGGGLVALVVTVVIAWAFYAVTCHLAATFFIGDVPTQPAATVGVVPAVVSILLGQYGLAGASLVSPSVDLAVAVAVTLVADGVAIAYAYDLDARPAAILTALHFAFSVALVIPLNNLLRLV